MAAVFLFGGAPHCEDAVHGEEVVFRQVAAVEESWGFQEEPLVLEGASEFTEGHVHERVCAPAVIVQDASLAAPEFGRWASPNRAGSCRDEDLGPLLTGAFEWRGCRGGNEINAGDGVEERPDREAAQVAADDDLRADPPVLGELVAHAVRLSPGTFGHPVVDSVRNRLTRVCRDQRVEVPAVVKGSAERET